MSESDATPTHATSSAKILLTRETLGKMLEYSASLPTGTLIGKWWSNRTADGRWRVGTYVPSDVPGRVAIHWYDVEIVEDGGEWMQTVEERMLDRGMTLKLAEAQMLQEEASQALADERKKNADLQVLLVCTTCGGDPESHPSLVGCICGDGSIHGEVQNLREEMVKTQRSLQIAEEKLDKCNDERDASEDEAYSRALDLENEHDAHELLKEENETLQAQVSALNETVLALRDGKPAPSYCAWCMKVTARDAESLADHMLECEKSPIKKLIDRIHWLEKELQRAKNGK